MVSCDQYRLQIQLYFDNELKVHRSEDFQKHFEQCVNCRNYLKEEGDLSEVLRSSRPLFSASDELREQVAEEITRQFGLFSAGPIRAHIHIPHLARRARQAVERSSLNWRTIAAAVLFAAIGLTLAPVVAWHVSAASYADAALEAHRGYLAGNLPPEVLSSSPETVTKWFAGKVPFNFRLPVSQPSPQGRQAYRLIGARLVKYRDNYAALVVYAMNASKISLMVTSERSAEAAGGDEVHSGNLTFHNHSKNGMNIITWSTHGLTYALVSSVQGSVRGSCLVCHQDMTDQNQFKDHTTFRLGQ
jgi:hypothetical protein